MSRTVLAIDLATVSGCCEGAPGSTPRFYNVKFGSEDHPETFARARHWIDERIAIGDLDAVYVEAPLRLGAAYGHTNADTSMRLIGLWAVVSSAIIGARIKYREMDVQDIRRLFIGSGTIKRDEAKARARLMCEHFGWAPSTPDEADAGALWWCASVKEARNLAPVITPMDHRRIATAYENGRILREARKSGRAPRQVRGSLL